MLQIFINGFSLGSIHSFFDHQIDLFRKALCHIPVVSGVIMTVICIVIQITDNLVLIRLVSTGDAGGGAMYFSGSHAELENVEFSNNVAGRNGGAFCAYSAAQVTVTNMTATSNRSGYRGGVIYIGSSGTVVSIYSGEANSNTATNNGNTIYCGGSSTLNIKTDAFTYEAGSIKGTIKEI